MKRIDRVGAFSLIAEPSQANGKEPGAHIVIDRLKIDEQGFVCLTQPGLSREGLDGAIEILKAELDAIKTRAPLARKKALH